MKHPQLIKLQEGVQRQQETIAALQATYERLKPQSIIQQGKSLDPGNTPHPADVYNNRGKAWMHLSEWDKAKAEFANLFLTYVDFYGILFPS